MQDFAKAGDTIRLRFEMGTDACTGFTGWYLDDVRVYQCFAEVIGVELVNPSDDQEGEPGKPVIYHLQLANTGNQDDSYTLIASGNNWPVDLPSGLIEVQAGASRGGLGAG